MEDYEWNNFCKFEKPRNVIENLSLAVFKEMVGLGSQWYCVIKSSNRDFKSFLLLALHYLPKENFCIYPEDETLSGPFLHAPWIDLGRNLCSWPTISIDAYIAYLELRVKEGTQH